MISQTDNTQNFISNINELPKAPDWLTKLRTEGFTRFSELGFPTVKNEEWKYTNIADVAKRTFSLSHDNTLCDKELLSSYCDENEINFVFVNGIFCSACSNFAKIPSGIKVLPLNEAITSREEKVKKVLTNIESSDEASFVSLNKALTSCGAFIQVDNNIVSKELIHIVHITSSKSDGLITAPRTLITIGKSSEVTILESHLSVNNKGSYLTTAVTDISLAENAILHYVKAQNESKKAYHFGTTRVWQERNSNFDGFSCMTGGKITRNDLTIVVNGEGSNSNLHGLYCMTEEQLVDNHSNVDHKVPNCTSNQLYKGILTDSSRAVFNGKIFVRDIAQQTNSYQLNKNLLMGNKCRVDTKPQLEIFADDVKCTHGATVGQLNKDELFYLQTRSIPKKEAIKMLSRGFVDDIFDHVQNESICAKLNQLVDPVIEKL